MKLDEMTMTDLAAMFALMGLLARGQHGLVQAHMAYDYAEELIRVKQEREENEDGSR